MTEADHRLVHAYVTDGKEYRSVLTSVCPDCEYEEWDDPDYSTRQHFPDLTAKLFEDDLYEAFEYHAGNAWAATGTKQFLIPWLFSDYARFCTLFVEFLRLPETVREFGWEEGTIVTMATWDDDWGDEKVTVRKPWAKLVEEGK